MILTQTPVPSEGVIYPDPDDPWLPGLMKPWVAVPTAAAAVTAGVLGYLQSGLGSVMGVSAGIVCAVLVVLSVIDFQTHRLPNVLVMPLYAVAGLPLLYAAAAGAISWSDAGTAGISMVALYLFWWLVAAVTGALGFGDVKLAGAIGLALGAYGGFEAATGGFVLPCLIGGLVAAAAYFLAGKRGTAEMAFGPYMCAGAMLVLLMPDVITPFVRFGLM